MPVGAFGGRREIMEQIAPLGPFTRRVRFREIRWRWPRDWQRCAALEAPGFHARLAAPPRVAGDVRRGSERARTCADVIRRECDAESALSAPQPRRQTPRSLPRAAREIPRLERAQRCQSRGHRHRISRKRTRLVNRPSGAICSMISRATAESADRHAAADDLAERRQVRPNAVSRLRAAERDPKSGL